MLAYLLGIKNAGSLPPISLSGGPKSNNRELKRKQENARGFPRVRSNVYCLISLAYAQPLIVSFLLQISLPSLMWERVIFILFLFFIYSRACDRTTFFLGQTFVVLLIELT